MRWKQWKPAASIEQAYVPILIRKCKNVGIMQRLEKKGKKKTQVHNTPVIFKSKQEGKRK